MKTISIPAPKAESVSVKIIHFRVAVTLQALRFGIASALGRLLSHTGSLALPETGEGKLINPANATASTEIRRPTNNFTPLRLLLASLVMLAHFSFLSGNRVSPFPFMYPDLAVDGFFVISGALIYASFDRSPKLSGYFCKRLFRLYPLYILVVVAQTTIFLAIQPDGVRAHLAEGLRYLVVNSVFLNFLQNHIGSLLVGSMDPGINPSLWTLKVEVGFYLLVPLIWLAVERWGRLCLLYMFILSAVFAGVFRHLGMFDIAKELPGALQFFVAGIALYFFRHSVRIPQIIAVALGAVAFLVVSLIQMARVPFQDDHWRLLMPVLALILVDVAAYRLPRIKLERDISYGVYLLHGPVIQLMAVFGVLSFSVPAFCVLIAIVIPLAIVAEWAVERPFIKVGHMIASRNRTVAKTF